MASDKGNSTLEINGFANAYSSLDGDFHQDNVGLGHIPQQYPSTWDCMIPIGLYQAMPTPFGIHCRFVRPVPLININNSETNGDGTELIEDWQKPDWKPRTLCNLPQREPDAPIEKYAFTLYCYHCGALGHHDPINCSANIFERQKYMNMLCYDKAFHVFGVTNYMRVDLFRMWCDWKRTLHYSDMELFHSARLNYRLDFIDHKAADVITTLQSQGEYEKLEVFKNALQTKSNYLIKNQQKDHVSSKIHHEILDFIKYFI